MSKISTPLLFFVALICYSCDFGILLSGGYVQDKAWH